jgi:G3E family GTPase
VIVNEFGDVGIDGRLVKGVEEDVVELTNGCLCCTIRGDLGVTVTELLARRKRRLFRKLRFDRLLIETSGLASPGPVLQTFEILPELREQARVDGTLTLAHAGVVARQIQEHPEAAEQIGYADRVVLNHRDRCNQDELEAAEVAVRSLNDICGVLRAEHARLEIAPLLDLRSAGSPRALPESDHAPHTVGAGTISFRTRAPLDIHKLKMWLQFVAARRSHDLWRLKGIARCHGIDTAVVAQGIYQWLEIGPEDDPPPEESVIVLIGRDLDREELERAWGKLTEG